MVTVIWRVNRENSYSAKKSANIVRHIFHRQATTPAQRQSKAEYIEQTAYEPSEKC